MSNERQAGSFNLCHLFLLSIDCELLLRISFILRKLPRSSLSPFSQCRFLGLHGEQSKSLQIRDQQQHALMDHSTHATNAKPAAIQAVFCIVVPTMAIWLVNLILPLIALLILSVRMANMTVETVANAMVRRAVNWTVVVSCVFPKGMFPGRSKHIAYHCDHTDKYTPSVTEQWCKPC